MDGDKTGPVDWSRRDFLKSLARVGAMTFLADGLAAAAGSDSDTVTISILHTTDLHGHILPTVDYNGNFDLGGFARCVTQIRRWRRQNRNSILIDIGDVYQGTDVSLPTNGSPIFERLSQLRHNDTTVAEHTRHVG